MTCLPVTIAFDPDALRSARLERGLSQRQLGLLVGRDQPSISRYENGDRVPPMWIARRLAAELGIPKSALWTRNPESMSVEREELRLARHRVPWSIYINREKVQ